MSLLNTIKEAAMETLNAAADFCTEHPQVAVVTIPAALATVRTIVRSGSKRRQIRNEANLKDRYIYDRSIGMYWETRRKMTPNERVYIASCRRNGEPMYDILRRMGLLKR